MISTRQAESVPVLGTEELGSVLRDYMEVTQRLQQTHEALQREVARLRREVESKDRELERRRRLAALGEMAAGVAHEVRNPLGAIRLYTGLLRSRVSGAAGALELLEKIETGIQAIDAIVQDTLALSPRGGRLEAHPLADVVAGALEMCRAEVERRGVRLVWRNGGEKLRVLVDSGALQRVFVNLVTNAIQASPTGGVVTVTVEAGAGGAATVRVADEGPGLPADVIEKIFDPFFTTKENGTGLGLAIAHRLVEAHGGSLTAGNRRSGGAEFVVELPTCGGEWEERTPGAGAERSSAA